MLIKLQKAAGGDRQRESEIVKSGNRRRRSINNKFPCNNYLPIVPAFAYEAHPKLFVLALKRLSCSTACESVEADEKTKLRMSDLKTRLKWLHIVKSSVVWAFITPTTATAINNVKNIIFTLNCNDLVYSYGVARHLLDGWLANWRVTGMANETTLAAYFDRILQPKHAHDY